MGIYIINCKWYKGGYDCGLFLIVYVIDFCFGNDLLMKIYI